MEGARGTIVSNMKRGKERWKVSMQDAIAKDLFGKAVDKLTDDEIINAAKAVGGSTWEQGLTSRQDKLQRAWEILLPKLKAHTDRINAMPNATDGDREKRMTENLRGMRALGAS
jgi:hypothetical protein